MRISEQISQLKQCVSDASDVKTDKVSILKRSVAFVKEAQMRIHCLQRSLRWLQSEHARLLTLVAGVDPNILRSFQTGTNGTFGTCSTCHDGAAAGGVRGGTSCMAQFQGGMSYRNGKAGCCAGNGAWNTLNSSCCEASLSQGASVHAAAQSHAHVVQTTVPHFQHVQQHQHQHQQTAATSLPSDHAHIAPFPVAHVDARCIKSQPDSAHIAEK